MPKAVIRPVLGPDGFIVVNKNNNCLFSTQEGKQVCIPVAKVLLIPGIAKYLPPTSASTENVPIDDKHALAATSGKGIIKLRLPTATSTQNNVRLVPTVTKSTDEILSRAPLRPIQPLAVFGNKAQQQQSGVSVKKPEQQQTSEKIAHDGMDFNEHDIDQPEYEDEDDDNFDGRNDSRVESEKVQKFWKKRVHLESFPDVGDATELFLHFFAEPDNWKMFQDSKTRKNVVFKNVAQQMESVGYLVHSDLTEASSMCRNKWKYLKKKFADFVVKYKKTGGKKIEKKKLPPYYEKLSPLLSDLHEINPAVIMESMVDDGEEVNRSLPNEESDSVHDNIRESCKSPPKKKKKDIILEQLEKNREVLCQKFDALTDAVKTNSSKQLSVQEEMSNNFAKLVNYIVSQPPKEK